MLIEVEGAAWVGFAVCEKPRVLWIDMISPAVPSDDRKKRRTEPIISPIRTSRITARATPLTAAGSGGMDWPTSGTKTRASASEKESRMRTGTKVSPTPGISMTRAPRRAKIRPAAKTCWAGA